MPLSKVGKSLGEVPTLSKDPIKLSPPLLLQTPPHLTSQLNATLFRELRTQRAQRHHPLRAKMDSEPPSLEWGLEIHKLFKVKISSSTEMGPDDLLSSSHPQLCLPEELPPLSQ